LLRHRLLAAGQHVQKFRLVQGFEDLKGRRTVKIVKVVTLGKRSKVEFQLAVKGKISFDG